jgi:hypothetical protein
MSAEKGIPIGPKTCEGWSKNFPGLSSPIHSFGEDAEDEALDSNRVTSQEVRQEDRPKEEPPQKEQLQGESRQEEPPKKESPQDESPQSELPQEEKSELKARDRLRVLRASFSALTCDLPHAVLCH